MTNSKSGASIDENPLDVLKKRAKADILIQICWKVNKTDNGICIYRSFKSNIVTAYVQKVRYSWLGKIGFTSFSYDVLTRQYLSI